MRSLPGAQSFDSGPKIMHLPVREGMQYRRLMGLGEVSVLGLGCARLGSLTEPRWRRESLSLIAAAVNAGINLFDTADIYAQGESERILGEALRSIDACIVTKAGQIFSLAKGVPLPLRGAVMSLFAHSSLARAAAIRVRARPLPRNLHAGIPPPRFAWFITSIAARSGQHFSAA